MPYINEDSRIAVVFRDNSLNDSIEDIIGYIQDLDDDQKEGVCNFVISRIVAGGMKPDTGWRYMWMSRAYGVFQSAGAEFYRRLLGPLEDEAIKKNGDIPEYM
jgi:hypothetical protein